MPNTSWKYFIVYETTNLVNGRKYIGCHKTNHINDGYLGSGTLLKRAIKKHGEHNFSKKVLFIFDNEQEMFDKERELITEDVIEDVNYYNVNSGGKGGFTHIHKNMDKYREMFSKKPEGWEHWSKREPERHSKTASKIATKAAKTIKDRMGEEAYKRMMREIAFRQKGIPKKSAKGAKGSKWATDGISRKRVPKYYVMEDGWKYGLPESLKTAKVGKVTKKCAYCDSKMTLYPSQAKTRECCSRSCSGKVKMIRRVKNG